MIEEIVPFPKELATETVVTCEDTSEATGQRVCKFNLAETLCIGYVNLILKSREIDSLTVHGYHLSIFRQAESQLDALFDVYSRILQRLMLLLLRIHLRHLKNTIMASHKILEHSCFGMCLSRPCEAVVVQVSNSSISNHPIWDWME